MSKKDPSTEPKHWYMATVKMTYIFHRDENRAVTTTKEVNILITPTHKYVTEKDVEDIRNLSLLRLRDHYNVDPETVTDFTIMNLMYFGLMSEAQYFGVAAKPQRV